MATITLQYQINISSEVIEVDPAIIQNKMSSADLFRGELDLLMYDLDSDTTTIGAGFVQREIVLLSNAQSDELFPDDAAREASVKGLYKSALNLLIPAPVSESITIT